MIDGRACRPPDGYRFSAAIPFSPNAALTGWQTSADLWFELGGRHSGAWVCVPAGFLTDLASIPAMARPIFNPVDPRYARAAVIHDYLLALAGFSPITAAIAFRDALRAAQVPEWRVAIMTTAVALWTCTRRRRL